MSGRIRAARIPLGSLLTLSNAARLSWFGGIPHREIGQSLFSPQKRVVASGGVIIGFRQVSETVTRDKSIQLGSWLSITSSPDTDRSTTTARVCLRAHPGISTFRSAAVLRQLVALEKVGDLLTGILGVVHRYFRRFLRALTSFSGGAIRQLEGLLCAIGRLHNKLLAATIDV